MRKIEVLTKFNANCLESLGQVLGYNGCYDSGTCPRDYISHKLS